MQLKPWDYEGEDRKNRDAMIDRRMMAVAAFALDSDWDVAKRKGVANYVRKVLEPMTAGELALMMPTRLHELVEHAAHGYERFMDRRAALDRRAARARVS